MPADDSTLTTRYPFKISLCYLLIRSIPLLVLYVVNALPRETFDILIENYHTWLFRIYPVMPVGLPDVPHGFQDALVVLPVLIIEVLLVFLFSTWFIWRKPWAARSLNKNRWLVLILAIVVWSLALRHELLAYLHTMLMDDLMARQDDANWLTDLPLLLLKAYWSLMVVLYVTAPLWAWLPVWLHFRVARQPADITASTTGVDKTSGQSSTTVSLQNATVFASFLLGCVALHFVIVQAVYMGLWPWAAQRTNMFVPQESVNELSLALSLSQIVLVTLVCAVAAYVYTRRSAGNRAIARHFVAKPMLAGIGAYLLTCFLVLAFTWFVLWLSPGFASSLLRQLSDAPESGIIYAIAVNVISLVLLCLVSDRFGASPRRWSTVLAGLVLCASVPAYVGWTLASTNMGIAGGTPGVAVTGQLGDARWRSMEQWCTGVVQTRQGTWLIGRKEESVSSATYLPAGVPDLSTLVTDEDGSSAQQRGSRMFGSRPLLTTLSLLQDDGTFKVMAVVPEVACMVVSPESETLFLFTGIRRPQQSSGVREQTAIFRSADHGVTWEWLEAGFMAEAQWLAWSVRPVFSSEQDVWAWGAEPPGEDDVQSGWGRPEPVPSRRAADGTEHRPTALLYSADQGRTSSVIYSPEPLVVSSSYLQRMTGELSARMSSSRDVDQFRFVVQVNEHRAYAWVSENTWYHVGEDSERLMLTTRAELSRAQPEDEWEVTQVIRQHDVAIRHLSTSLDGQTYAILNDENGGWLARLDTASGEWIERHRTPAVLHGWLAQDNTSTRYFWSNGDYQVVSQWGYTVVPRLLMPFYEKSSEIITEAHYYTRDGGRTWHQLAIPDYLGVMGLSPHGSKLYWSKGNWYRNDEPQQWEYDLSK